MATSVQDHRLPFVRVLHRSLDLDAYFETVDLALRRLVPFDASCWLSLDPATRLPTSHVSRLYGSTHLMALVANEYLEDDVNKFADSGQVGSARRPDERRDGWRPAPQRQIVDILAPLGFEGDELRAVFRDGDAAGAASPSIVARAPSRSGGRVLSPTWAASWPSGSVGRSSERP